MDHYLTPIQTFLANRLNLTSRIALLVGTVALVASFFFPLWRITLEAPQYSRGLYLEIYSYQLEAGNNGNDLQEINILNHYIGMQPIEEADFVEMTWIPFAVGFFVLFSLRTMVFGTMKSLVDTIALYFYFSLFSLGNFVYRLYSFGHDLDPTAPVNVEPFMPALLGKTEIANFTQFSYPAGATYCLIFFLLCLLFAAFWSRREGPAPCG